MKTAVPQKLWNTKLLILKSWNIIIQMERQGGISSPPKTDINESIKQAIQNVSGHALYQRKVFIFFMLVAFITNILFYSSNYYYMNPVFECEDVEGKATEDDACDMLNFCQIINQGTITAELQLYCGSRKESRTLIQTASGFGNVLGLAIGGWFSDVKGRKLCFCIALLAFNITWACQFLGVHFGSVSLLLLSEFISGAAGKMIYLNFLLLLTRFLRKQGYEAGTLVWMIIGQGVSQMAIAGINGLFGTWRAVAYSYSFGIVVLSIAAMFVIKEDPVFLFDSGLLKESRAVVEEVGLENGEVFQANQQNLKKLDYAFEAKMLQIGNGAQETNEFTLNEILRCDIFQKVLIIGLAACLYHMAGKSIELSIQSMELSYNFNLFIIGLSNACGFATAIYIIRIEPQRKRGFILTSIMYGILALLFLFPFCTDNGSVQTVLIFLLRFFLCWSCNFYTRLKVDSFPEKYQMTIMGAIEVIMSLGSLASPTLIQLAVDYKVSPIVFIDVLRLLLGTLPLFLLNEERTLLHADSQRESQKMREIQT